MTAGFVAYRLKEGQTAPERGARLLSYLYPIVSTDNPLATSDPNARNEGVFRVMVRTSRYFSEGEVPRTPQKAASVTGMLRSTLTARNIENGRLLAQQFPGVDPDSVMVLEDRQQPMNILAKLGLMLAGMSLLLLAWIGRRARLASQSMAAAVPFLEHFSQAFARFFMRVGLPSGIAPFK